jgi:2-polyprenyl-3-methyl-5-hydroxy-6-metoxy-1,4-benzoquinol methylase
VRAELMDEPGLDAREHRQALIALGRANAVSRTVDVLWPRIHQAARNGRAVPLRILDVASGSGDVAVGLARRAARDGLAVEVTGCDVSPVAVDYARALAARAQVGSVRFEVGNALAGEGWPADADVVVCCLFLHHLGDEEAVALLRRMRTAARRLVLVSDLRRSPAGYLFAWAGCRLLSRSRVFHVDGTLSVEAAFTTEEARRLAQRAGLTGARVTEHWPQRWLLSSPGDAR